MSNTKYEFTNEARIIEIDGVEHEVKRIRALTELNPPQMDGKVHIGDLGGWIESERNLEGNGMCWVDEEAVVVNNAVIKDNAYTCGHSIEQDNAVVCDNATVDDNAVIKDNSIIQDSIVVKNNVIIIDNSVVKGIGVVWNMAKFLAVNWNVLIENLKELSFDEGDFDDDHFKTTVKGTFNYFCDIAKSQQSSDECYLSIEDCMLVSHILAYAKTIIYTSSDIENYCLASQYVALTLYEIITKVDCWSILIGETSEDRIIYQDYKFIENNDFVPVTIEYNVDIGDMSDILSKIEYVKDILG